jgi:hypothetical protein
VKNPENYRQVATCLTCKDVERYPLDTGHCYFCYLLDSDVETDVETDHVCFFHQDISSTTPMPYQKVDCCENCVTCIKTRDIDTRLMKTYECSKTAKNQDDLTQIKPNCVCDWHVEDE